MANSSTCPYKTLTIQTGFSTIYSNNLKFRDSTIKKGRQLIENDELSHVFNVSETRKFGSEVIEISGRCVPQTSVSETAYFIDLTLDVNRFITHAHCNCTGGSNGLCKHTSAVIQFVNEERTSAGTDQKCTFKAPSRYGQQMFRKGQTFEKIFCIPEDKKRGDLSFKLDLKEKEDHLKLMIEHQNTNSMLYKILSLKLEDTVEPAKI